MNSKRPSAARDDSAQRQDATEPPPASTFTPDEVDQQLRMMGEMDAALNGMLARQVPTPTAAGALKPDPQPAKPLQRRKATDEDYRKLGGWQVGTLHRASPTTRKKPT